ncbi:ABC transporter substrate-binding protein, partial [Hamadaea sp. NPDC051192]|uniref:ABC transporter substrate-binding protein n=1 Tax=Hamadaea sp. NPDC051192 TaxID=3154940 RepID=UPI003434A397
MDRSLVLRTIAAGAAVALAFTGCSAVMPGALDQRGGGVSVPGVTADTVTVVFVGVDLGATSQLTGFTTAPAGDPAKQVEALADHVNAHGGIAGRKLKAVFRSYEASDDSPAAEERLCNQVTQDDRAFAVVLTGQLQANARPCYARRNTLVLDATLIATDTKTYRELSPYLWSASFPGYDEFVQALVRTLAGERFFDGVQTVGVVAADAPINRSVYDALAKPQLAALGVTPTVSWIDTTDLGTLNAGLNQAAVDFRSKGIQRVMFLGGARLAAFFLTAAAAQDFTARYAVSSFDNPSFLVNNPATIPAAALRGMVGVGFNPSQDVPDRQYPFPSTQAEKDCVGIFAAAGQSFATRENARVALPYCDAVTLLAAATRDLGPGLSAAAFTQAAQALGTSFAPAAGFSGRLDG